MKTDPQKIKEFMQFLSQTLNDEIIVIGGWAVHAYGCKDTTFDGDAMISYRAEGELGDSYLITKNPRRKKSRFQCEANCDIDLYVEHQHGFRITFEEIQAYHEKRDGMNVACPEHLLVLKIDAFKDRHGKPNGAKDKEDLIRLLIHALFKHPSILEKHFEPEALELLPKAV